jgi:hypothetical protein
MTINLNLLTPLFLVFLVLKLTGFIAWSWWWITAPLWGPFALAVVAFLFLLTLKGFAWTSREFK